MHAPYETHMLVAHRIFKYLKSAPGKILLFSKHGHLKVKGYTDINWAKYVIDWRSTLRYNALVEENLAIWHSKNQSVVARSSVEAEFSLWLMIYVRCYYWSPY